MTSTSTETRSGTDTGSQNEKTLSESAHEAGEAAYRTVRDEAEHQTDVARGRAASEVGDIASALRHAADSSRSGSTHQRTFGQLSEMLDGAATSIRTKDMHSALEELNAFARGNPVAFLGSAALLGFAATRFAKASQQGPAAPMPSAGAVPGASGAGDARSHDNG